MLHIFINYYQCVHHSGCDCIVLINCIDHIQQHVKIPYKLYVYTSDSGYFLKDIEQCTGCKVLYNDQQYNDVLSTIDDYKMFIDYGTMLSKDITELYPCYVYTNKLDYIYKDTIDNINTYLYDSQNDQSYDEFLRNPKDTYSHYITNMYFAGVVAIGKGEEAYLDEWINHYIQLGFSKIYFYDNNPENDTSQQDICAKYPQVVYRDVRGWPTRYTDLYNILQLYVYNDAYYNNDCNYLLFVDVDEFLVLKDKTLSDLLRFKKYIHINWQLYGDDEQIYKDDRPVMERFVTPVSHEDNKHVKSIVQTHNNVDFINPHYCMTDLTCVTPLGNICDGSSPFVDPPEHNYAIINHYFTKSAEEFIDKMNKGSADGQSKTVDMYFEINKKTQEKIDFFKSKNIM